jgi:hypothetical protein
VCTSNSCSGKDKMLIPVLQKEKKIIEKDKKLSKKIKI